ncbi:hypothetical protein [Pseudarthrobacter sp. AB1]|uniref:hypothetical protein n=1 Tax=Pseudarthrobacter sp. AB1 TaxID=2138309 RepID=UPI00186B83F8|nr:hypothetical protein [Pseudarthrobacter sp. AB1]MBE4720570.1 hypothetical protein [Pseudarthrobacter sp. AB1]
MLEDDKDHAVRFEAAHYIAPAYNHPGRVTVDFHVDREPNAGQYLAGEAATLLSGDLDRAAGIVESLATDHLREATGTSTRIHDDGYSVSIEADVPADAGNVTEKTVHSPAAETERPLAAEQTEVLFELELAFQSVLPVHDRHHAETLARLIAKELPSQAEVVQAYYRPTLNEVLEEHERRFDPLPEPDLPPSLKTAQLSFPRHPSAALIRPPLSAVATATSSALSPGTRVELER